MRCASGGMVCGVTASGIRSLLRRGLHRLATAAPCAEIVGNPGYRHRVSRWLRRDGLHGRGGVRRCLRYGGSDRRLVSSALCHACLGLRLRNGVGVFAVLRLWARVALSGHAALTDRPALPSCCAASTMRAAMLFSASLPYARGSYCFLLPTSPSILSTPS